MVQPMNYLAAIPQPNIAAQLSNLGATISANRESRKASTASDQYRKDLETTFATGTPEAFAALIAKYPQQREAFRDSWDILSDSQRENEFTDAAQLYNAIQSNPEVAKTLVDERITAMDNSGIDSSRLRRIRQGLDVDSAGLKNQLAFTLSTIDPDRWAKISSDIRARDLAPSELTAAKAKAFKAAVDADFAESNAALDLQKKGWDVTKIQNDIRVSKDNQKIAALNADLRRHQLRIDESKNQTQRDQLRLRQRELESKLADAQAKRDATVREKVADAESARGNIDNMLNNVDRILQLPAGTINDSVGAWDGSWLGGVIDTFDQDVQNFKALMENLDAQSFLAQVPQMKGLGALSENEGKKLGAALQSFNTKQSEGQFIANLRETQRLMMKARKNLSTRYGVPDTVPDTPAVETSPEEIQALLQKYGGS